MDRSPVRMTWAQRAGGALAVVFLWCGSTPAADAPAPPAAAPPPAVAPATAGPRPAAPSETLRPSRITGMLEKYRPPNRTLVVMKPAADGKLTPVEVGLAPDAVVIVDGMETPAAGLQSGRPVTIERRPGAPMRVVQGVLPPSRYKGTIR